MNDYFIFDDIDTRDYEGIYVYFDSIDTTPKRVGEFIEIPNRNGSFFLDGGRYEDVPHTYDVIALTTAVGRDLINALASKVGHFRLEDSFNSDEYYSAALDAEIEPTITTERDKITFKVMFTRKPQRWLKSGEAEISVSDGDTITNPTRFEASPLIECKGYGNIFVRGLPITVSQVPIGNVLLSNGATFTVTNAEQTAYDNPAEIGSVVLNVSNLNTGDDIYVGASEVIYNISNRAWDFSSTSISDESGESWSTTSAISSPRSVYFRTRIAQQTFKKGTSATKTYNYFYRYEADGGYVTSTAKHTIKIAYDGNQTVKLYASTHANDSTDTFEVVGNIGQINGYSTIVANNTFYIDLDIGEAYFISNNVYSSANYAVSIPPKLPTLRSGTNTITYSNTITNFKITPRWWRV